ncbi:DUF5133 domain-containing protein [Streptomyces sp. NPDC059753]|uniref:DUF5133 domain-containing protein n=1 Tax=Streptomyces sp. NPDC059753 TaxID=3346933 RepID=UPI00364E8A2C
MLMPKEAAVARQLTSYRAWEHRLLAVPADLRARERFEDAAYTLCVLTATRCGREAADAAENYMRPRTPQPTRTAPRSAGTRARPAHHAI